jgi:hypothetical protein
MSKNPKPLDLYLVHVDGVAISIEATSITEAIKLATKGASND